MSQTPQVSYLTTDHLGSPRIITDGLGKVIARHDYSAFGDETYTTQRTNALGYKPDTIRQDYTGYQKDDESGLEFAQARYYNTAHGRFTSVDPLTASANVKDPQTFNRYSYVLNSPYKFSDPLGLLPEGHRSSDGSCGAENSSCSDDYSSPFNDEIPESHAQDAEQTPATDNTESAPPAQEADPPASPPAPAAEQNADDPTFLAKLKSEFPTFNQADSAVVNGAIDNAQSSTDIGYATVLRLQFNGTSGISPQQAVSELKIGQAVVTESDASGTPTAAELNGTIFDGRTSTLLIDDDNNAATPQITIAQFFARNSTIIAVTASGGGQIFLGSLFFSQNEVGKAKTLIHEGVVHRGFGKSDGEFDPGGQNRRSEGSQEINKRIDKNFRLRQRELIQ